MNLKNLDNIKVDEKRIENMKRNLYKKEKGSFRFVYVAASLALVFVLGFAFPSYTKDLPIYSNIFTALGLENYQKAGEFVNASDTYDGTKITIVNALYSNDTLSFSYIIETDKDLGDNINPMTDIRFKNNKASGLSGTSYFEKKADGIYIGYGDYDIDFKKKNVSPLGVKLRIESITDYSRQKDFEGNWKFDIVLDQIKADIYKYDISVEKEGLVALLDNIAVDKAGTEINLNLMHTGGLDVFAYDQRNVKFIDQEEKEYKIDMRGSSGSEGILKTKYKIGEKLEKNKNYKLILEMEKNDGKAFSGPADGSEPAKEITEEYVYTEAYKKAPNRITIEVPIKISD